VIDLAATVVAFGLVEIVLVLFAIAIIAAMVSAFGHPALDNFRSRCPQCSAQSLVRLDNHPTSGRRHRLRVFRCGACGSSFREEIDGTLTEM